MYTTYVLLEVGVIHLQKSIDPSQFGHSVQVDMG